MRPTASASAAPSTEDTSSEENELLSVVPPPSSPDELIAQSGKLCCLRGLLPLLAKGGHRVLIFSQSLKMLDAVAALLKMLSLT